MKNTKKSLVLSIVTLLLCTCMFVGSTFAWFTDTVSNTGNKIQAGTLDIGLEQFKKTEANPTGEWIDLEEVTDPVFNYDKWEPGYSNGGVFKIVNKGNLALKYTLQVAMADGTLVVNDNGHSLADVIDVYYAEDGNITALPESFNEAKTSMTKVGTLADIITSTQPGGFAHGVLLPAADKQATNSELPTKYNEEVKTEKTCVAIVLHMQEDAGNEYQGMSLGASFDIRLLATQVEFEKDGFNSNLYDEQSIYPLQAAADYDPTKDTTITIYDGNNKLETKATIPTGSTIPEGTEKIEMTVDETNVPEEVADELEEDEVAKNLDVKFFSVKSDGSKTQITDFGTKIVNVDLSSEIPDGHELIKVFHTHDGVANPMTKKNSATDVGDGDYYFNATTKMLTIGSKTFSPFTFVTKPLSVPVAGVEYWHEDIEDWAIDYFDTLEEAASFANEKRNDEWAALYLYSDYKLTQDIELTYPEYSDPWDYEYGLRIYNDAILDLNNHTLKLPQTIRIQSGNVTIKNGTIRQDSPEEDWYESGEFLISVSCKANLTIDNVEMFVDAKNTNKGIIISNYNGVLYNASGEKTIACYWCYYIGDDYSHNFPYAEFNSLTELDEYLATYNVTRDTEGVEAGVDYVSDYNGGSKVTLNDSTLWGDIYMDSYDGDSPNNCELICTNSNIYPSGGLDATENDYSSRSCFDLYHGAKVTINSGNYIAQRHVFCLSEADAQINIYGGYFEAAHNEPADDAIPDVLCETYENESFRYFRVMGGTFKVIDLGNDKTGEGRGRWAYNKTQEGSFSDSIVPEGYKIVDLEEEGCIYWKVEKD